MAPTLHSAKQSRPAHVSAALEATDRLLALKNYSPNTIKNYRNWLMLFFYHFEERKPSTISKEEVMGFLQSFRQSSKWSASS
ncbi:MAG: phage integrase N-terminal SAM-like domain-containing protein, partial [Flavobacteriales bacterium]